MKKFVVLSIAILALLLAACGGGEAEPAGVTLDYVGNDTFVFEPGTAEVAAGAQVTINFENAGVLDHNWMLISGSADATTAVEGEALAGATTGIISGGETATVTFTAPPAGNYQVVCTVPGHAAGGMVAEFVVSGG